MAGITFLGTGRLGRAMARCTIGGGYETVVWNRTAEPAERLVPQGANYIPEVSQAISQSPIIIVCVEDYKATDSFLKTSETEASPKGRILIQLSTGTPQDARAMYEWASSIDVDYLDGAIYGYPNHIGHENAGVDVSGDRETFEKVESILQLLAPNTRYVGEDPGSAAILDMALLSATNTASVGVLQGIALCEAAGVSVKDYGERLRSTMDIQIDTFAWYIDRVSNNELQGTPHVASLNDAKVTFEHIVRFSDEKAVFILMGSNYLFKMFVALADTLPFYYLTSKLRNYLQIDTTLVMD